jgi:predicted RNA binding protein YcfA (HicA-like mRNA interferase family)
MPRIPGVNHLQAIRALEKAGFKIVRQGKKHIVLSDGTRFLTIPRNNPINSFTMAGIVKDAGLKKEDFLDLF